MAEDICRFIIRGKALSSSIKRTRHKINSYAALLSPSYRTLLKSRDSAADPGRRVKSKTEFSRKNPRDILISNFKRTQESLRVLEEISKIINVKAAAGFKELRYKAYEAEKKAVLKIKKK